MGISSMMVVVGIDCSTSTVRSMIVAGGLTSDFLIVRVRATRFFLVLRTVG